MSAEPTITQAEMDKYFETGGKEAPAALVEAEKTEVIQQQEELKAEVPRETTEPVKQETQSEAAKPDGEVQVQVDGKTVPLSELLAERKERQAWQTTAAQQQQQLTDMLKIVQERAKTMTAAEAEAAPDPNADPFGYMTHVLGTVQKEVAEVNKWRQETVQTQQAQEATNRMLNWAQAQRNEFVTQQKDYDAAYNFAKAGREAELRAFGLSPTEIQQTLDAEQAQVIQLAVARTMQGNPTNPAKLVYEYAKARGYKAEIVAAQKKVPDLDDKMNTIVKGQEASKGVSGTSGGAPSEINNLQDLAAASGDMSDDEFSKAFDKLVPRMKGKYV